MLHLPQFSESTVLVVDIQERLLPAMEEGRGELVLKATRNLLLAGQEWGAHLAYSEQYPKGLGDTVAPLKECLEGASYMAKTEFSVLQNPGYKDWPLKEQVILTGMETHVCVLQTGLDLLKAGHKVFVPVDAVASRTAENRLNGLAILEKAGALLLNSESLIFNQLGRAEGETFKKFSKLIR